MTKRSIEDLHQELVRAYFPKLCEQLRGIIHGLQMPHNESSEDRQELIKQVHSIGGAAGSYGFSSVSILARNLEAVLQDRKISLTEIHKQFHEKLENQLKELIETERGR